MEDVFLMTLQLYDFVLLSKLKRTNHAFRLYSVHERVEVEWNQALTYEWDVLSWHLRMLIVSIEVEHKDDSCDEEDIVYHVDIAEDEKDANFSDQIRCIAVSGALVLSWEVHCIEVNKVDKEHGRKEKDPHNVVEDSILVEPADDGKFNELGDCPRCESENEAICQVCYLNTAV